jgi:hypothetical protein
MWIAVRCGGNVALREEDKRFHLKMVRGWKIAAKQKRPIDE